MAVIGDLVATLSLNNSQFNRGIEQSRGRLDRMRRGLGGFRKDLSRSAKQFGLLATAATTALGAISVSTLHAQDRVGKLAKQLGISTQALTGLRFAADQTGAGADKLSAGLEVMSKRLGEVATKGSGAAAPAIEKLGLNVQDLIRMSPDEQFKVIAERMQGIETQSERNAIAANIFSRANQGLVNTLAEGREGLERYQAKAEALGITLTQEQVRKAADAVDAMDQLKKSFKGAGNIMASSLAPAITAISNGFKDSLTESVKSNRESIINWGTVFGDVVATAADIGSSAFIAIKTELAVLGRTIGATMAQLMAAVTGNFSRIGTIQKELEADTKQIRKVYEDFDTRRFRDELEKTRKKYEETEEAATKAKKALGGGGGGGGDPADQENLRQEIQKTLDKIKDIEDGLLSQEEKIRQTYKNRIELVKDAAARRVIAEERANKLIKELREKQAADLAKLEESKTKKVRKEAEKSASKTQKIWDNAIENIQRAWGDAWTDIFRGGSNAFERLSDRVKDIFARLAGEIVSLMTTRAIQPIIEGFTGIKLPGGGGGGGLGSIFGGGGGGAGSIVGSDSLTGQIADGVAKKLGLGGAGAGSLVQRIGAKIGFAGDVQAVQRASQGTAKGLTARLPGSLGGALAAAGGGFAGSELGRLVGQRFGGETGGRIGGGFGGAVGSIAGPIGSLLGSAAGSFFGSGLDRLVSGGSSSAERLSGALDVMFPGIGSLLGSLGGIFDQEAPRLAALTAASRGGTASSRGFKGSPTQTPFGFFGFSQAASETAGTGLSDNDLNKFENLIKGVDEQVARFLTDSQVEAVREALQSQVGSRGVKGGGFRRRIGGEKDIGKLITGRFQTIFKAIDAEIPEALRDAGKAIDPKQAIEAGLKPLQELFTKRVQELTSELNEVLSNLTSNARELLQFRQGFTRAGETISQQLFRMTGTSASPLSPTERLQNARSQFESLLGRARGGDIDALQQVSGSAQNFLDIARRNFASSPAFFEEFNFARDALSGLQGVISQQQGRIDSTLGDINVNIDRQTQMTTRRLDSLIEEIRGLRQDNEELRSKLERLAPQAA